MLCGEKKAALERAVAQDETFRQSADIGTAARVNIAQ